MPGRWTHALVRHRLAVIVIWAAILGGGILAATQLSSVLANSFAVPGSGSDHAGDLLAEHFGERPEGTFVVVFRVSRPSDASVRRQLRQRLTAAARVLPTAKTGTLQRGGGILYAELATPLRLDAARAYTDRLRRALSSANGPPALVTGQPALERDLEPILAGDLRRGEAIALPAALLVLIGLFGLSTAVLVPFAFAASTVAATLIGVDALAHLFSMTTYVTNLVVLVGLGLAIDYSLLIVYRYREELGAGPDPVTAIVRTMATAGRTVMFSGITMAAGLGLLLFVPVPFVRSIGAAGLLVPLASVAAALTLQPALLSLLRAPQGTHSPGRDKVRGHGAWESLARWVIRWRVPLLVGSSGLLIALASMAFALRVVPSSFASLPRETGSSRAIRLLRDGVGPGAITPTSVVVDAGARGSARSGATRNAVARLADELFHDPEVLLVANGSRKPFTDRSGQFARVLVVNRHEYGADQTRSLVRRLRARLVPAAHFPPEATVEVGGAPAQGVDFLASTYDRLPWLALLVLGAVFLALLRAFRSLVLPLQAVLANLLTVTAVYGALVLVFQHGVGAGLLGLHRTGAIEGWVPIFLFAALVGLSTDYEVFLVMRMREIWDRHLDTTEAVAGGSGRTGQIITAAAVVFVASVSGFLVGRVAGLQQLGLGLSLGVLLDATIVRGLLVPSLMAVLGRSNWWLPTAIARLVRATPSPPAPKE
jgi:RND superfamily putative drug exporter